MDCLSSVKGDRSTSSINNVSSSSIGRITPIPQLNARGWRHHDDDNMASRTKWIAGLDINQTPHTIRKTSIICTIGPSTNSVEKIVELRKAGMNIVRLNFSHGSYEYHASVIANVRESERVYSGRDIAIALDTKGPEIRAGKMKDPKGLFIPAGHEFILTSNPERKLTGDLDAIYMDYTSIGSTLSPGSLVYMDDGNLCLKVIECYADSVRVRSINGHHLLDGKGVNLPYAKVDLPAISEKDKEDLRFAVEQDLDMIFASFIRRADDVLTIRRILQEAHAEKQARQARVPAVIDEREVLEKFEKFTTSNGTATSPASKEAKGSRYNNYMCASTEIEKCRMAILAKIENHEGVMNLDEILLEADGIMVARGDLGIEIPPEKVFIAQKMMIARANLIGKPVICATQMLESMTGNPRPTRAEASDVANAVLDGADCVMLSAETARGMYPVETVRMMHRICLEAECAIAYTQLFEELRNLALRNSSVTETIASSAVNASLEPYIHGIIVLTESGTTAREVAKYRPQVPIIAVTRSRMTARLLHLNRGCYPIYYNESQVPTIESDARPSVVSNIVLKDNKIRVHYAMGEAVRMGLLRTGQHVVVVQGCAFGTGHSNGMKIEQVI